MKNYTNNISARDYSGLKQVLGLSVLPLELQPLEYQQKSFYGKAKVFYNDELKEATLYSYDTPILRYSFITKEYRRLWSGWSATTAQHIKAFVGRYITKAEWVGLGVGLPVFSQQELEAGDLNKTRRQLA